MEHSQFTEVLAMQLTSINVDDEDQPFDQQTEVFLTSPIVLPCET